MALVGQALGCPSDARLRVIGVGADDHDVSRRAPRIRRTGIGAGRGTQRPIA